MMHADARRRLREARVAAGLSLRDLARRVGVSASLLSQIENGKSDPSVSSLYALVSELGLSLDALLAGDSGAPGVPPAGSPVLRAGTRRVLEMDSGVRWEQLTTAPDGRVEAVLATYEPGGQSSSSGQLMTHAGVEFAYLIEGELTLELGFATHLLRAGDSLMFESSTPHLYRNLGSTPARGVWYVLDRAGARTAGEPVGDPAHLSSAVQVLHALHGG